MDKRVEIHGTSRADMNGKRGVATDFHPICGPEGGPDEAEIDPELSRYTVQLDSSEAFKVKLTNVRAEGTVGGASASAGKAKGKKGRGGRK